MESATIQAQVEACRTDISGHFRAVYDHLVGKVFAYTQYRVSNKEQAIDLTQDVFIDLYEALPTFTYQSDAQFYSFVFTITRRKLAKHYEQQKTESGTQELDESTLPSPIADTDSEDALKRALMWLDEETREIVALHHWSRYTFPEIASLLNMTESAARVRHHRALKSLAKILTNQN